MADFLVKDLLSVLEEIAPVELAESWDNVGLMAGDPGQPVRAILAAVDPTEDLLLEAEAVGANALLTHHPIIFQPLRSIRLDQPTGRLLAAALRKEIAIISCHTNLDVISGGVSDELACRLGLHGCEPLSVLGRRGAGREVAGFGRIGGYPEGGVSGEQFLVRLFEALEVPTVQMVGSLPERVTRVAVCGGSGSALVQTAFLLGAQVLVTGEVKHSEARWAEATGFCVIDAGHYSTESLAIPALVWKLQQVISSRGFSIPVLGSRRQKTPFSQLPRLQEGA